MPTTATRTDTRARATDVSFRTLMDDPQGQFSGIRDALTDDEYRDLMSGLSSAFDVTRGYHATRTEHIDGPSGILATGLQPRFGGTGASEGHARFEPQSKGHVHYSRSLDRAADYRSLLESGSYRGRAYPGVRTGSAEILAIAVPRDMSDQVGGDFHDHTARKLTTPIPPEQIRRLSDTAPPLWDVARWPERRAFHRKIDFERRAFDGQLDANTRALLKQKFLFPSMVRRRLGDGFRAYEQYTARTGERPTGTARQRVARLNVDRMQASFFY